MTDERLFLSMQEKVKEIPKDSFGKSLRAGRQGGFRQALEPIHVVARADALNQEFLALVEDELGSAMTVELLEEGGSLQQKPAEI